MSIPAAEVEGKKPPGGRIFSRYRWRNLFVGERTPFSLHRDGRRWTDTREATAKLRAGARRHLSAVPKTTVMEWGREASEQRQTGFGQSHASRAFGLYVVVGVECSQRSALDRR